MLKSTLVKFAVAAVLAMPAVPMFGKTVHRRLVTPARTHRLLVAKSHRLTAKTHRRGTLSSRRKLTSHRSAASRHLIKKTSLRHTAAASSSHFRVRVTKMPPTIDGINT